MKLINALLIGSLLLTQSESKAQSTDVATQDLASEINRPSPLARQFVTRSVRLPFTDKAQSILTEKVGNIYFYQGDIMVDTDSMTTISVGRPDRDDRWPEGKIPIVIAPNILSNLDALEAVYDGLNAVMINTEMKFVPRGNEDDYVLITRGSCPKGAQATSNVGRQGGRQELRICVPTPTARAIAHELLHAAGVYHEQSREDRDKYIDVELAGMPDDVRVNFDKVHAKVLGPYDYMSIMHYSETAFSPNTPATPTIFCKTDDVRVACPPEMGRGQGLSQGDIAGLDALYSEISMFSDGGWDAQITRPVRTGEGGEFSGNFIWNRKIGMPRHSGPGVAVNYVALEINAPREMIISWRGGKKSVKYTDWRDSIAVNYSSPQSVGSQRILHYSATVPSDLPMIVKAKAVPSQWVPPQKPAACVLKMSTCYEYGMYISDGAIRTADSGVVRYHDFIVEGAWSTSRIKSPLETAVKSIELSPVQKVAEKPLWSMSPVKGVYVIEPSMNRN